jgi:hypothetical protein
VILTACSSLPPAQHATDVSAIAGKWRGTLYGRNGSVGALMDISPNGRYVTTTDSPIGQLGKVFTGTVAVEDGKFRYRSETTGSTGTLMLHEGEGKRVLAGQGDAGGSSRLVPVQ